MNEKDFTLALFCLYPCEDRPNLVSKKKNKPKDRQIYQRKTSDSYKNKICIINKRNYKILKY